MYGTFNHDVGDLVSRALLMEEKRGVKLETCIVMALDILSTSFNAPYYSPHIIPLPSPVIHVFIID